jgi:hypothetical protein
MIPELLRVAQQAPARAEESSFQQHAVIHAGGRITARNIAV